MYSVITKNVLYDMKLTPNAKVMYAIIYDQMNESKVCRLTNKDFVDLTGFSVRTTSKLISELARNMYIQLTYIRNNETGEILEREIRFL